MEKGGCLVYRCRYCGKVIRLYHVPNVAQAVIFLAHGLPLPEEWGVASAKLNEVHACENHLYGMADFIGGEEDPE